MSGAWTSEPDTEAWVASGLPARIVRHPSLKHLCGYVAVPAGHPAHGKHYDAVEFPEDGYPHGGLTYGEDHAPREAPDGNWWLGFDCAHAGDFVPGADRWPEGADSYKDWSFVRREVEALARTLSASGQKSGGAE